MNCISSIGIAFGVIAGVIVMVALWYGALYLVSDKRSNDL